MADLNEVRLIGRLTRDPETRMGQNWNMASFGLATGRQYKKGNETVKETTFVDITCFGKLAEVVAKYLKKGRLVFIGGRLKLDNWEDGNGNKRSKLSVIAEDVQFLDGNGSNNKIQATGEQKEEYSTPTFDEPPF